ncbi:MAG: hypothetical protein AAGA81_15615 [Acidobacteriota bacterium]
MRQFLPTKGPGGRELTAKEKAALVILACTLILCVLTLLAGDRAFSDEPAQNPVFGLVGVLAGSVGVGILAAYGLVLLWSALIFFKGERVAGDKPMPGRVMATLGVTVALSGLLGVAQLAAAGELGSMVGSAMGNTFGGTMGFALLLAMMLLGGHLAGQGAWNAFRGPALATAAPAAPITTGGFTLPTPSPRVGGTDLVPDDGESSADERSRAISQAMDEIERSQGVTIVEVEEQEAEEEDADDDEIEVAESRTSIGEAVEALEEPEPETEEAQVQQGLDAIASALAQSQMVIDERSEEEEDQQEELEEDLEEEVVAGEAGNHGLVPVPAEDAEAELEEEELDEEEEDLEEEEELEEEEDELEEDEYEEEEPDEVEDELEEDEYEEEEEDEELEEEDEEEELDDEEEVDEDELEEEDEEDLEEEEDEEEWDDEAEVLEEDEEDEESGPTVGITQPYLFPIARREFETSEDEASEDETGDGEGDEETPRKRFGTDSQFGTNFDWRGRPLD